MKLVREHINEKFTEDSDPIYDMGIGAIRLIEKWLKEHNIFNYTINKDLTIDVDGYVEFRHSLAKGSSGNFPKYIQFRKIYNGYFSISHCNLTSLRGCPESIDRGETNFNGDFNCDFNKLTSLKYAPKRITGHFICHDNQKEFSEEDVRKVCSVGMEIKNLHE